MILSRHINNISAKSHLAFAPRVWEEDNLTAPALALFAQAKSGLELFQPEAQEQSAAE
jgi:hypothetical protein|tara:strand:- start:251 stop:424 length:174 start_codon:yes stop_codon:yes gene_type:complete